MGFFGTEFIDVRRRLGAMGPSRDLAVLPSDIDRWVAANPNGVTLYFAPGRYVFWRWQTTYGFWQGDYVFPPNALLWFEEGASFVFEEARIVIRGNIRAPLSRIFRRERGVDSGGRAADPLLRGHILIESDLPAVYPEWWGALTLTPSRTDDEALRDAIDSATALRAPLSTTNLWNAESGNYVVTRREGPPRPPIPVIFSNLYRLAAPLFVGEPIRLTASQLSLRRQQSAEVFEFGRTGSVSAILRGNRVGATRPKSGLVYVTPEREEGRRAVLHLKNSYGATVDGLLIDASGNADYGIIVEPTGDVPQMHSVAIQRCWVKSARVAQIQVGPPANVTGGLLPVTVTDTRELDGRGPTSTGTGTTQTMRQITVEAPVTFVDPRAVPAGFTGRWVQENGLDTPGLVIDDCLIDCRIVPHPYLMRASAPLGIQLRAQNGVANLVTNCRFRGEATAFVDARATMTLVENCDFENNYFTEANPGYVARPASGDTAGVTIAPFQVGTPDEGAAAGVRVRYVQLVSVNGVQQTAYLRTESLVGNLGFEPPSGQDVYLSADPVRIDRIWEYLIRLNLRHGRTRGITSAIFEKSSVEGAVAMHGCTSSSAMLFGTVRPGPIEGKRSERTSMVLGCVHMPRWAALPRVSSVQWGRAALSRHRSVSVGTSPGYSGDPCFSVVGSYLEAGIEVFRGAAQCAAVAFNSRLELRGHPISVSNARLGVSAQSFIFGLALALLSLLSFGCNPSSSAVGSDGGESVDVVHGGDNDVARGDATADAPADASLFPFEIPGTIPFDSYRPPAQARRNCPAPQDGDPSIPAPRLVSPLSPLRVTSQRPTLSWELPPGVEGVQIQLCRDPCCANVLETFSATGTSMRPPRPLRPGVVFWRARGMARGQVGRETSFTWEFGVPHRDSTLDTFKGAIHDFDGDGYDDVVASVYDGVRVYWGGEEGLAERRFSEFRPGYPGQAFSNVRLFVTDANSDGLADVLVSGHGYQPGTTVHYGTLRAIFGHRSRTMVDSGWVHIVGVVGEIADLNGDGFVDVLGVAPLDYDSRSTGTGLILYGAAEWTEYTRGLVRDPVHDNVTNGFGFAGTGGDVDGDGYGDTYIGNHAFDGYRGRIYFYRGGDRGLNEAPSREFDPPREIEIRAAEWGAPLGIGDVNGDRLADLMVLSEDTQQVLLLGARSPGEITMTVMRSTYPTSYLGAATGPSVDFDGNGVMDLFLGCSVCLDRNRPLVTMGRIVVMTNAGDSPPALLREFEPSPADGAGRPDGFGQPILAVDINGDGYDDMISMDPERTQLPNFPARGYLSVDFGGPDFGARRQQVFGVDLPYGARFTTAA
jgi:FG-GAP-like repeat